MKTKISEWFIFRYFNSKGELLPTPKTRDIVLLPLLADEDGWLIIEFTNEFYWNVRFQLNSRDCDFIISFIKSQNYSEIINITEYLSKKPDLNDLRKSRIIDNSEEEVVLIQIAFKQITDVNFYELVFEGKTGYRIALQLNIEDANRIAFFIESRDRLRKLLP